MQHSLQDFRPKFLGDLIRVGNSSDGGYVVNERVIVNCQDLISFGVSHDWSFEADFLTRRPNLKVLCFDNSVSKNVLLNEMLDARNETFSLRVGPTIVARMTIP
jgi:hypothetical protein